MEPPHPYRGLALSLSKGFTLVELMVVLAIVGIITTIVFTSQNSFNNTLVLANTAYDIALTLRSAQTYGLSSRATASGIGNTGYGLHFGSGTQGSFILFADTSPPGSSGTLNCPSASFGTPNCRPGDNVYKSSGPEADTLFAQTYTLGNGMTISNFCTIDVFDAISCATTNGNTLAALDIAFARPNPDAFLSKNAVYSPFLKKACITVSSPQGTKRFISVVMYTGQIIANAPSCP